MKKLYIHIALGLFSSCVLAQTDSVLLDTIVLSEKRNLWLDNPGHIAEKIEQEGATADKLAQSSAVHIRSAGPGSLVALAYRGMNSNQLNITWEGIRLNSPALGLTDIRLIPSTANGEMQLIPSQSWKEGAGQGAGSLNYAYRSPTNKQLLVSYGVNSLVNQDFSVYHAGRARRTSYFNQVSLKRHLNRYYYEDPTQISRPLKERENNNFNLIDLQGGIEQKWNGIFSSKILYWTQLSEREIPGSVVGANSHAIQQDEAYRFLIINSRKAEDNQQELKFAYLNETVHYQDVNNIDNEHGTESIQINFRHSRILKSCLLDLILFQNFDQANSSSLLDSTKNRNQSEIKLLSKFPIGKYSIAQANFAGIYTNQSGLVPQYKLAFSRDKQLQLGIELGSHYRLPTLNDLYWNPGGNASLQPETGLTSNFYVNDSWQFSQLKLTASVQVYWNIINNWIQWAPVGTASYWSPQNLKKVHARGFEIKFLESGRVGNVQLNAEQGFYLNQSRSKESYSPEIILNKQLIYNPLWQIKSKLALKFKHASLGLAHQYCSSVYYQSGTYKQLQAYQLFHVTYSYKLSQWELGLGINNLLNEQYELQKHFPQVGRSYQFKITYKIN